MNDYKFYRLLRMNVNQPMRRSKYFQGEHRWLMIPLILLFFLLILRPAVADSPTFDEFNHITRGLALWHTHDPYHSDQHPPLANLLSTFLAYTLIDTTVSVIPSQWEGDLWSYGRHILWGDNFNYLSQILFLSRLTIIFLTLGLALAGYRVAYQMWGRAPALMAFFLLLFEPNLMAHGHYVTNDVSITLFAFVTTYLLWRLWQKKERRGGYWLLLPSLWAQPCRVKVQPLGLSPSGSFWPCFHWGMRKRKRSAGCGNWQRSTPDHCPGAGCISGYGWAGSRYRRD